MPFIIKTFFAWAFALSTVALIHPGQTHAEMARYNLDLAHSTVEFRVAHMVVSKTTGQFMDYTGFIDMDTETGKVKALEAVIHTQSVNTNHPKRDTDLRSPEFFHVDEYPTMTYTMTSYQKTGDEYTAKGNLTLLGVTKEITLVGTFNGVANDPWENVRAGFTGEGTINRKDFGMKFSKTLDNGGLMVGDEVQIRLDIECIKAKKAP